MAKKTKKTHPFAFPGVAQEEMKSSFTQKEVKPGLDIKLKLEKSESGRLTVTVTLFQDGVEIASDYDFVNV